MHWTRAAAMAWWLGTLRLVVPEIGIIRDALLNNNIFISFSAASQKLSRSPPTSLQDSQGAAGGPPLHTHGAIDGLE